MAWQPEEQAARQLSQCLRDSLSGHNKAAQKQAEIMLAQAKSSPDINNYLAFLFSSSEPPAFLGFSAEEFHAVRSAAAIMLKNNIRTNFDSIPQANLDLIKSSIPLALQDKNSQIRSYAGNVITEIVTRGGFLGWPQLLPDILQLVGNESGNVSQQAQEGAMAALAKICEDNTKMLDKDYQGQRPLNVVIPKLIAFSASPSAKVRSLALASINVFIPHKPQALLANIDVLLNHLFQLANDESPEVRTQICRAFVQIVEVRPDKILPHIEGLVNYMLAQQQRTEEEELACDAAEFWLSVGEHDELWHSLSPYLHKIVPVLLECMVYSEDDILLLGGGDDADEEDREEDLKPQFAKSKSGRNQTNGQAEGGAGQNGGYDKVNGDDDFEEGEIDDYDDDSDDDLPEDRWNLRKCSAAALDVFANDFKGVVFETILPYLLKNLRHDEWPYREAAVLALGAVAQGCMDVVTPHLPDLVPYLISLLNDKEPLVRQITCWTLGRYSAWAASMTEPALKAQFFEPMMDGLLTRMLDSNKRVQEAAASAFAHLEEKAGAHLTPYCEPIIRQFVRCFDSYKDRNMFILYDCVQTLAENVGSGLAQGELVNLLMPTLILRWRKVSDQSRELFPLLECLSYVATALGDVFAQFAPPIFTRCIKIIHQNLQEALMHAENPALDAPDKDFLVTSLDLLSAVIQALDDQKSGELVSGSQPGFFELLTYCMEDPTNDVRQSSYALLGDCAKYVYPQLQPFLPTIIPILIRQLDLDPVLDDELRSGFSVVNNACWSTGEIAMQSGKALEPYIQQLYQRLINILSHRQCPPSLHENAAIALGRLGLENHDVLAPHLSAFAQIFLDVMDNIACTDEKGTAFKGFVMIVGRNPQAMERDLVHFFTAIARYDHDPSCSEHLKQEVNSIFQQALDAYKSLIPDFNGFLGQLAAADQQALRSKYSL